jgi:hypothetical protein
MPHPFADLPLHKEQVQVLQTRSKVVAVLATPATFRGQLIKDVVEKFAVPADLAQRRAVKLLLMPLNMPHPFADLPLHKEQVQGWLRSSL